MNTKQMKIMAFALLASAAAAASAEGLKDAFAGKFSLGAAFRSAIYEGRDQKERAIVERHFNAITAENEMKPFALQPKEGVFNFETADRFVEFGEKHGMKIIGHCLVWHNQMPGWFFKDASGKDVDRDTLIARMRAHIHAVVGRYKGRIYGWDVVNEAFGDDGELHDSPWLRIIGSDFMELAFRFAHEADPDVELYYNDFSMAGAGKRRGVVRMIRDFRAKGIRIDAIGMQTHVSLVHPSIAEYEASLEAFAAEGVKVMVTEMDVSALPAAWGLSAEITTSHDYDEKYNPWKDGKLPAEMQEKLARRYEEFFSVFLRHAKVVDRVTLWGVTDGTSWLNNFPVRGRTDYPLFFDRAGKMKPCAAAVAKLAREWREKPEGAPAAKGRTARFNSFALSNDGAAPELDGARQFANPIMPGMAPDPSITRKGGDYYLANSSFSYFPGIPVWHSTNLVDWDFCGYCGARPSQLALKPGVGLSAGVFAPDIKYNPHNDTFYLIVTVIGDRGNVIYKTRDPRLGWGEPIKVPVGGIDPSMYFEDDKTAWILNNDDAPDGKAEYPGHRTVRMRRYDLVADKVVLGTERIIINKGIRPEEKPIWCEGPHLYKIGVTYYVMTAEGGTGGWHSEVIWRADSVEGPYKPCPVNPILTQRGMSSAVPGAVTCAGHADLVETPEGEWWAVFLGVTPYIKDGRDFSPTGRSTFLLPVKWIGEGDTRQPVILEAGLRVPRVVDRTPATAVRPGGPAPRGARETDGFTTPALDPMWFQARTPREIWYRSAAGGRPGLELEARPVSIYSKGNPSCLMRWVKNCDFSASVAVSFDAKNADELAGLAVYQNEECNYVLGVTATAQGAPAVTLEKCDKGTRTTVASAELPRAGAPVVLKAQAKGPVIRFAWACGGLGGRIGGDEDATILTTDYAGGFVGATVGLYATTKARE